MGEEKECAPGAKWGGSNDFWAWGYFFFLSCHIWKGRVPSLPCYTLHKSQPSFLPHTNVKHHTCTSTSLPCPPRAFCFFLSFHMNEAVKKGVDRQEEDMGLHARLKWVALLSFLLGASHVSLQSYYPQRSSADSHQRSTCPAPCLQPRCVPASSTRTWDQQHSWHLWQITHEALRAVHSPFPSQRSSHLLCNILDTAKYL